MYVSQVYSIVNDLGNVKQLLYNGIKGLILVHSNRGGVFFFHFSVMLPRLLML